jgi:NADH-quinone oxidoreductase subunit C
MDINYILEISKKIENNIQLIEHHNQYTFILNDNNKILNLLQTMKTEADFDMLIDITAIDWNKNVNRFDIVYFLYSNKNKNRIRIKTFIDEKKCSIHTAENIYPSANWYEREIWDMYGIKFEEHSDMRRFYMPEDFFDKKTGKTYHPLRKDFPLTGIQDSLPLPPYPEMFENEVMF